MTDPAVDDHAAYALLNGPTFPQGGRGRTTPGATPPSAAVGIVVVDGAGRIRTTDAALRAMFGYAEGELEGQPVEVLVPPSLREVHERHRGDYERGSVPHVMGQRRLRALHASGATFPVEIALCPSEAGDGLGATAVVVDLSTTVELAPLLERTFDAAPYGLAVVQPGGVVVRANACLERMVGRAVGSLAGTHVTALLPGPHHGDPHTPLALLAPHGPGASAVDVVLLHANGVEVPVEVTMTVVPGAESSLTVLAFADISDRRRLERNLRDANTDLEQFAFIASHDLRSPLSGVGDLVEWIADDLDADSSQAARANLDRIRTRVARMDQLIGQLLTYARLGRGEHRKVVIDLDTLVADALSLANVPDTFTVDVDIDVPPFLGSSVPLSAVVRNLVSNAVIHHDRTDGRLTIRARAGHDACRIEIVDDGPGIPWSAQARIFHLFQTAHSLRAGGGGIGLAVCRRLCETYGGSIDVTSEPGVGASFVVEWPLAHRDDRG